MTEKKYDAPAAAAALELLEFMAAEPGAWGPTELARRLELTPNLTFRILNVLVEKGYVKKDPAGQYELTAALFSLGMKLQHSFDLRKQARPFLEKLALETRESVQLQVPDGDRMLQLDFVAPPAPYYQAVTPGSRIYWHGNAFGKAVWAFLPEDEAEKIMALPRPQMSIHTVTDPQLIRKELEDIRRTCSSSEFEEYLLGNYCIGSPVFNAAGRVVAGVGITGMSSRLVPEMIPGLREKVLTSARNISNSIGFQGLRCPVIPGLNDRAEHADGIAMEST